MKRIGLCFCLTMVFFALLCGCGSEQKDLPSSTEQNEVFSSAGKQAEPENTESQDVTETATEIPQTSSPTTKEPKPESTIPSKKRLNLRKRKSSNRRKAKTNRRRKRTHRKRLKLPNRPQRQKRRLNP